MKRPEVFSRLILTAALSLTACSSAEQIDHSKPVAVTSTIDSIPTQESITNDYRPVEIKNGFLRTENESKIEFPVIEIDRKIIIDLLSSENAELKISVYGSDETAPLHFSYDYEQALTIMAISGEELFDLLLQNEQVQGSEYFLVETSINGPQVTTKLEVVRIPLLYKPHDGMFDPEMLTEVLHEKNIFTVTIPSTDISKIKTMVLHVGTTNILNHGGFDWGITLNNYSAD